MIRSVVWRPQAVEEYLAAFDWYQKQRSGLGWEFIEACQAGLQLVRAHPESFRQVHNRMRRVLLRRFPYAIYYRSDAQEIVILAVIHGRRDPRRWQSRR